LKTGLSLGNTNSPRIGGFLMASNSGSSPKMSAITNGQRPAMEMTKDFDGWYFKVSAR
jgi:hypothetical protein